MMTKKTTRQIYVLCALVPLAIMIINFIILGVFPFGKTTVMAIDFASQYIDLFAYLKRAVLSLDIDSFFYSFSKSLGGDMVGLWGYYLLSPFNLIYVIIPFEWITSAATLTILARYSAMGLTFGHLLIKRYNGLSQKPLLVPIFATLYTLSGFAVANQMNPLWYDALVFLPLVIIGVEEIMDGKRHVYRYVLMLAAMIIMQYYMAYMMCLFIVLYSLFYASRIYKGKNSVQKIVSYVIPLVRLACYSVLAVGVSAIILYPVVQNLLITKGTYTESVPFTWAFEFNPLEIVSKLFIGAFDYDQMPNGLPNIYVGAAAFIGILLYFSAKTIRKSERVMAFMIFVIFVISMAHDFTNKIWHLGQTPAWFFHRFTYLTCFFIVLLGYRGVVARTKIGWRTITVMISLIVAMNVITLMQTHSYMTIIQQLISVVFWGSCIVILFVSGVPKVYKMPVLLFLTVAELLINANVSQSRIGYAHDIAFKNAQSVQKEVLDTIRPETPTFYRIGKMFTRTKNDPFMFDYPGLTNFSSTMEATTLDLFDYLGDAGSNASTNYGNGTPLTDALFGVRYMVQVRNLPADLENNEDIYHLTRESTRKDLYTYYTAVSETNRLRVYENKNVLPIGFGVPTHFVHLIMERNAPAYNQNQILQALMPSNTPYFESFALENVELDNFTTDNPEQLSPVALTRNDVNKQASISYTFTPQTNEAYYISLPATTNVSKSDLTMTLNGQIYEYYRTFDARQLFNVSYGNAGEKQTFTLSTNTLNNLNIYNVQLWRLNGELVKEAITQTAKQGLQVSSWSDNRVEGTITLLPNSTYMMTSIPYSQGWQAWVDGQQVHPIKVWDSLMAIPMTEGTHHVKLVYTPVGWWMGVSMTAISLLVLGVASVWEKKR